MGQQQLLLIVLGVIIVGIAIVIAIVMFRVNAVENSRDILLNQAIHISTMAQQYYKKPSSLGGGDLKFTGWRIPTDLVLTEAGRFSAIVGDQQVEIIGTANEVVNGTDSVKISVMVFSDSMSTTIIH